MRNSIILQPIRAAFKLLAVAVMASAGMVSHAQALTYDFDNATLQGWNNRVWNGSTWIDLAPNATTYAGTLLPASGNNGLFVPGNSAVWVTGNTDFHLNTLWLRSPQFYLSGSGSLTVQVAMGTSRTTWVAPLNDSAVPFAAAAAEGWMGVALRSVSNNQSMLPSPVKRHHPVLARISENSPDAATDTIVITVPAAKAAGGKLFGLLRGTVL